VLVEEAQQLAGVVEARRRAGRAGSRCGARGPRGRAAACSRVLRWRSAGGARVGAVQPAAVGVDRGRPDASTWLAKAWGSRGRCRAAEAGAEAVGEPGVGAQEGGLCRRPCGVPCGRSSRYTTDAIEPKSKFRACSRSAAARSARLRSSSTGRAPRTKSGSHQASNGIAPRSRRAVRSAQAESQPTWGTPPGRPILVPVEVAESGAALTAGCAS
jgi:hypothetical protein